jgi:hypothetical protein
VEVGPTGAKAHRSRTPHRSSTHVLYIQSAIASQDAIGTSEYTGEGGDDDLFKGASIRGRITNPEGQPIADASVSSDLHARAR